LFTYRLFISKDFEFENIPKKSKSRKYFTVTKTTKVYLS